MTVTEFITARLGEDEPEEVQNAWREVDEAIVRALNIEELPRGVGQSVRWLLPSVVWTRLGDNRWISRKGGTHAPSSHVASIPWELVPTDERNTP